MALAHDRGHKAEGDVRNRASGEHKSWGRGIPGPGTGKPGSGREGLARGYTTAGPEGESQQVMEAPSEGTTSGSGAGEVSGGGLTHRGPTRRKRVI